MHIAIKSKNWKTEKTFLRKSKNGTLSLCNGKLIIMYLSISKKTYWDAYSNQDEWKKHEKYYF